MPDHSPDLLLEFRTSAGIALRADLLAVRFDSPDGRIDIAPRDADLSAMIDRGLFGLTADTVPAALDRAGRAVVTLRPGPEIMAAGGIPPAANEGATPVALAAWMSRDAARLDSGAWLATRLCPDGADTPTRTIWDFLPGFGELSDAPEADAGVVIRAAAAFLGEAYPELPLDGGLTDRILTMLGMDDALRADPGESPLTGLHRFLIGRGAEPDIFDDGAGLRVAIEGESGTWPCVALADTGNAIVFYGVFPAPVAAGRRPDAYTVIGQWNSRRLLGALDLDPDSGYLAVRLPILLDSRPPTGHLWQHALDTLIDAVDHAAEIAAALSDATGTVGPDA